GSIALLKFLRGQKKFYYRTEHFISVSGLLYRMKQNAAGLAGICILSTSVLVMLSSTVALYVGMDDVMRNHFPRNIMLESGQDAPEAEAVITAAVGEVLGREGLPEKNPLIYRDLSLLVMKGEDGAFETTEIYAAGDLDRICPMYVMPQEDYNRITGNSVSLAEGQCKVISQSAPYHEEKLTLLGQTYRTVPAGDYGLWEGADSFGPEVYYLILPDLAKLRVLDQAQRRVSEEFASGVRYHYGFDLDADPDTQIRIFDEVMAKASVLPEGIQGECAAAQRSSYFSLNAGLLFLGIFLGTLFVMATVLIIYYKQVTEGYEDKSRFEIMRKVGLSKAEIKRSIRSQILLMFFLPLAAAAMHIWAAFPIITRLLAAMNLTNVGLFAATTAQTLAAFAAVYAAVYLLTSRVYLKIVS
ncbi:MAG: ABC transporter permease, partial [Clostridium sp.]|nr:ABC transporter permease [Clostridium sp.]